MAVNPRDIPLGRDQVASWLAEFVEAKMPSEDLRQFLTSKLEGLQLHDTVVNTADSESALVDLILDDLPSYGFDT